MCLNSYSFINEQLFSNEISVFNFYQFLYFWNVFADILKQQNAQYANSYKRNSKTKGRMTLKIGKDVQYT